jgi:hypothetical protein
MKSRKLRRHSGRITPRIFLFGKKQEIIENCLEPKEYWDDWEDYRDGFRISKDKSKIRNRFMSFAKSLEVERWNKKIRLLIRRRIAKRKKARKLQFLQEKIYFCFFT